MASIGGFPDGTIAADAPVRGFLSELQRSQDSLRTLATETGGFAAVNRNDFTDAFARIVRENSSYYVLGYYPTNDRRDGRFRRIEVRVKRPGPAGAFAPRLRRAARARTGRGARRGPAQRGRRGRQGSDGQPDPDRAACR